MTTESNGAAATAIWAQVQALGWPSLGQTTEGLPLPFARLGGAEGRSPLVVVGGVHGDEGASVEAVLELAGWLEGGAGREGPVWVIPVLNPDGYLRGTKNSARDVDLNRNFPARNFTTVHRPGYFPGPEPLSEPETRAFADLLLRVRPVGVVAVHAPFACINHDGPARAWAEAVAVASGWPVQADIGYPTPGSLGSWLGVDQGLPVLTLELPPGPYAGFRGAAQAALRAAVTWRFPTSGVDSCVKG